PHSSVGSALQAIQTANPRGIQLISSSLLYSDLKSAYYRLELDTGDMRRPQLESLIRQAGTEIQYRIREDLSIYDHSLIEIVPDKGIDFRKSFAVTSPVTLQMVQEVQYSRREDIRKISERRIALISDGSAYESPHRVVIKLERDAYLLARHAQVQPIPLWMDSRNEEEFIKTIVSLAQNYFAIRISDLSREYTMEVLERIEELVDVPIIHAETMEIGMIMAAMLENAARQHNTHLQGKTVGIIGLGPEGHGLKQFLAQMGVARILGIDADFRQLTRFEKRDGIASSIDHVYDNADFLLITPGYKTRLDEKRLHPGQIILSFSPGVVDESSLEQTIAERIYQGPDPHPIFIMPGLIGAIRQSRIQRINIDHLYRLMSTLTGRASEYSFLPAPSTELFKAQFQALG
ncbi:MAG: hypothetical protein KDK34_23835, partial [Leptospiraceae bacterium]|nr:hypothetical protein [Leptospiraceae bacterium]